MTHLFEGFLAACLPAASDHPRARRVRGRCAGLAIVLWMLAAPAAFAQSGAFVEVSSDVSPVTNGAYKTTWRIARVAAGVQQDGRYGFLGAAERYDRGSVSDFAVQAGGFRRGHGWTISGFAGFTSQPEFLYKRSFEGEVVRELGHGFVVHGGYRYIDFPSAIVTVIQPGGSWYYRRGDIQVRGVLVHHGDTDRRSSAVIARSTFDLSRRVRLGGGVAAGNRIFDVSALAQTQQGWAGFGNVRVALAPHWFVTAGVGAAHEEPFFSQRTLSAALRRTF